MLRTDGAVAEAGWVAALAAGRRGASLHARAHFSFLCVRRHRSQPGSASVSRGTRSRCRSLAGRWEGRTVGSQHTSLHGHLLGGHAGQDSQVACGSTSSATKGGSGDARPGPVAAAKQVRVRIITLLGAMRELNERPRRSGSFVRVLSQLSSHRTATRRLWSCGAATSATRAAARRVMLRDTATSMFWQQHCSQHTMSMCCTM